MKKTGMTALAQAFAEAGYVQESQSTEKDSTAKQPGSPVTVVKKQANKSLLPKKKSRPKGQRTLGVSKHQPAPTFSPDQWLHFQRQIQKPLPKKGLSGEAFLHYLNNGRLPAPQAQKVVQPIRKRKLEIVGTVLPNRQAFKYRPVGRPIVMTELGKKVRLPEHVDDDSDVAEICIGLDFGTSSVKVVLCDKNRQVHYAVPFFEIGSENPYIFPSRVYVLGGNYHLADPADSRACCVRDMKLVLMEKECQMHMVHTAAFLALIVRHARSWLFSTHGDTYRHSDIEWSLNLGLPAEKSEQTRLAKRFERLALAAANLAGFDGPISDNSSARFLGLAAESIARRDKSSSLMTVHPDLVSVYPEIAAQVVAFVESEKWDAKGRPYITMVDIGAGTVDVSFFQVEAEKNKRRKFQFFANSVAANGAMNLHRKRVEWLKQELTERGALTEEVDRFFEEITMPTDRSFPIPEKVADYVEGVAVDAVQSIDNTFYYSRYRHQVFAEVINPVKHNRVPNGDHWQKLPVFICGGGSRMRFYSSLIDTLNNMQGVNWIRAHRYTLTPPKRLLAPGLPKDDYDRLSVAYGLSFDDLGEIIRSGEIPDFIPMSPVPARPVDMVSKDQC